MIMIAPGGFQQYGYWICAAAFVLATSLSASSWVKGSRKWLLVTGCATTSLWAVVMATPMVVTPGPSPATIVEILRDAIWIAFLISMPGVNSLAQRLTGKVGPLAIVIASIGLIAFLVSDFGPRFTGLGGRSGTIYAAFVLSILALVLVENLYRNCDVDGRWGVKNLCLGLGLLFGFDFVLYANALFAGRPDTSFIEGRGYVAALAVPLLLLSARRSGSWRDEVRISRDVAFHSAALLGIGAYLLIMAGLGMALPLIGGGPGLQLVFMVATLLALAVVFSSASFRSAVRLFVNKHFFNHRYDHREVWRRFIRDISQAEENGDLRNRVLHAVADIFDCPAAALWTLQSEDGTFVPVARWNFGDNLPVEPAEDALATFLATQRTILDIGACRRDPQNLQASTLPDWLRDHPRAWAVAPLIHNGQLRAFLVLGTPRAPVELDWETVELLKTLGEQAASYLAEDQSSRALSDAMKLEEFNRWSAFLMHDVKGIVGQMSLLVANAEKHAHDPAFQRDVIATVANSVTRMRKMMDQLNAKSAEIASQAQPRADLPVDLSQVVREVGDRWRRVIPSLEIVAAGRSMPVEARETSLLSVLDHLIQNAFDASGPQGRIALKLRFQGSESLLEVQDNGPGMDPSFVADKLFKPLSSSKPNGFGIGAFQVRQLVRGMGGKLEVETSPGKGTTMRVRLPSPAGPPLLEASREAV